MSKNFARIVLIMKTIHCPECGSGLQVMLKNENFEGWKFCNSCGHPSFVLSTEKKSVVKSLRALLSETKEKEYATKALMYIIDKGDAQISDMYFHIGKKAEQDVNRFEAVGLIKRVGNHYEIDSKLAQHVMKEIVPVAKKEQPSWYEELMP
ncbi:MAG: zinc ribbon domain-containing protein [Candidatus Micrarchaeota archaeon]